MKTILMLLIAILPAVPQTSDPLARQIKRDEGLRRTPYQDIMNRLVVGYGHKLDARCGDREGRKDENRPGATLNNTSFQPSEMPVTAALPAEIIEAEYMGTLDEDRTIGLTLVHDPGKRLHGAYFYRKYLADIPVEGEFTGERDIVLREHNTDGSLRGTFQLHFAKHDPRYPPENSPDLNQEILVGTWTDAKGSRSHSVLLDMETMWDTDVMSTGSNPPYASTPELEQNAQDFYFAVVRGNKQVAANHVHYPLRVNSGRTRIVHNPAEFLRLYDRMFTAEYVSRIEQGIPRHIWGNIDGWMIADGAVWFDEKGKATVLNVCLPVLRENSTSGTPVKVSATVTADREAVGDFTALSQSSGTAAGIWFQRLTSAQLRQFLTCMLRQNVDLQYYGPHLRFQYRIMPPLGSGSAEYLPVVVYDPNKPQGIFLAYEFRRGRCMKFGLENTGPVIYRRGKPDMLADQLYNGGIGTYNGFMKDMKKVMATPMVKMNVRKIPKTCAICSGLDEPEI